MAPVEGETPIRMGGCGCIRPFTDYQRDHHQHYQGQTNAVIWRRKRHWQEDEPDMVSENESGIRSGPHRDAHAQGKETA